MSMKVLINEYPHRTLALATDEHALVFRHTHSPGGSKWHEANPALAPGRSSGASPRCMVEFAPLSTIDLSEHRNVAAARGCLGLITLNDDVFICVVTGSVEVATLRPGETVQRIYAVEFYCLNRSDYDHSYGHTPNPYPGQTFTSEEFEHGDHYDSNNVGENPFQALQKLLSSSSFYYSFDFDLTRRLQDRADSQGVVDIASLDEGLLWNSYMIDPLLQFRSRMTNHERQELDRSHMLTSVIRGFARTLAIPPSSSPIKRSSTNAPSSLTVISRLSSRRAGTRFNSRGIDDNGNVANFVETETIHWSPTGLCFSYTQVRGSVPVFWESSSSLIPGQQKVSITRSPEATQPSFDKHFAQLEKAYGALHVLNLLSKSRPAEVELSDRYREHLKMSPLRRHDPEEVEDHTLLRATEFDFNEYTKGGSGFEGAKAIRPYIDQSAESYVYFLSEEVEEWVPTEKGKPHKLRRPVVVMQQNGVFRVNCLDCLDRTNLVQGMLSQMAIELFLQHRSERSSSDFWMRHSTLWADNGDALSKIYAGTGALKSSFTRHGKMSLAGALADARKSATRLYVNHFEDKHRQNVVDVLLGKLQNQTSVDLFDPVNDWVVAELAKRRLEFEKRDEVKVFVGTYNLNGKSTGSKADLSDWLHARGELDDVVVVGFQEIVELSPQQIMSTDPNRRMVWESGVRACLNGHMSEKGPAEGDEYVLLRSGQLVGAALLIFVRARMLSRIQNVEGAIKKTGMSGIAGNKGAVAIRMEIDSTSVCFVTAHLAAGFGNYDERNRDYSTITSGLRFQRNRSIEDHEVVIWAGDFNYRIGLSYEKARAHVVRARTGGQAGEDSLGTLYENDQLNIQMVAGNCFPFYREGRVGFMPTYKFDLGKDEYDSSEKARIPAWTDRILYKTNHTTYSQGEDLGTKLKQLEYDSVQNMRFSDHRPVYSTFELGVRVVDEARKEELTRKLYKKRAKEVNAKSFVTESEDDDEDDDDDIEETIGYQSIEEGLPPASSDRRKWWLDGNAGVSSRLTPPEKGMRLNPNRAGNPWRDGADDEWIKVEKPNGTSSPLRKGNNAGTTTIATSDKKQKPEPPPSRHPQRTVAPPWAGDRLTSNPSSSSRQAQSDDETRTRTPPPPPQPRRPASNSLSKPLTTNDTTSLRDRSPSSASIRSITSTASAPSTLPRKPAPPKPTKPSNLTSSSSHIAVPSDMSSLPGPAVQSRPSSMLSHATANDGAEAEEKPPPLPVRRGTASSISSTVTTSSNAAPGLPMRRLPPAPANMGVNAGVSAGTGGVGRRVGSLQQQAQVAQRPKPGRVGSFGSVASGRSIRSVPPTRHGDRGGANVGAVDGSGGNDTGDSSIGMITMMDNDDDDDGGSDQREEHEEEVKPALPPRRQATNNDLMDEGGQGEGRLEGWEVLRPR